MPTFDTAGWTVDCHSIHIRDRWYMTNDAFLLKLKIPFAKIFQTIAFFHPISPKQQKKYNQNSNWRIRRDMLTTHCTWCKHVIDIINIINGTNCLTPDAHFDKLCIFSDARDIIFEKKLGMFEIQLGTLCEVALMISDFAI